MIGGGGAAGEGMFTKLTAHEISLDYDCISFVERIGVMK